MSLEVGSFFLVEIEKVYSKRLIVSRLNDDGTKDEPFICFLKDVYIDDPKVLFLLKRKLKKNMWLLIFKIRSKPIVKLFYDKNLELSVADVLKKHRVQHSFKKYYFSLSLSEITQRDDRK